MSLIAKIVMIPQISVEDFPLHLSPPSASNCGGYILPSVSGTVYAYSPIDICVAAIEARKKNLIITDLVRFFRTCKDVTSVFEVYLGLDIDGILHINHVAYWKTQCGLRATLHKNAPLTFGG